MKRETKPVFIEFVVDEIVDIVPLTIVGVVVDVAVIVIVLLPIVGVEIIVVVVEVVVAVPKLWVAQCFTNCRKKSMKKFITIFNKINHQ